MELRLTISEAWQEKPHHQEYTTGKTEHLIDFTKKTSELHISSAWLGQRPISSLILLLDYVKLSYPQPLWEKHKSLHQVVTITIMH